MERVEKSTIPHGLLRVSHLPNWITMSDVEKASRLVLLALCIA